MTELQDLYITDSDISQSILTIEKAKLRQKQFAAESLEMQKKIESEIPAKVKTDKLTDKQKQYGDLSKKVAIKINDRTTIYVDRDKIDGAKERWLERYNELYNKTYRRGINVNNNR